jgi:hypothetical protein
MKLAPAGLQDVDKGVGRITVPVFPSGLRYLKKAGPNPHFLNATYFDEQVLAPFDEAFQHAGPLLTS